MVLNMNNLCKLGFLSIFFGMISLGIVTSASYLNLYLLANYSVDVAVLIIALASIGIGTVWYCIYKWLFSYV